MDEKLKQRLIGVLVVVGAVFIILPFLFHNAHPSAVENIASSGSTVSPPSISVALPAEKIASSASLMEPSKTTPVNSVSKSQPTQTASPASVNAIAKTQSTLTTASKVIESKAAASDTKKVKPNTATASTLAAGFKPDQAVSPKSGLTTGAPINAPPTIQKIESASAFDYAALNQAKIAANHTQTAPSTASLKAQRTVQHHQSTQHASRHVQTHAAAVHAAKYSHYAIQLAVFRDNHNALKLMRKLHAHHMPAYTRHMVHNGKRMTAVFVGPQKTHESAVMMQAQLHRVFHLSGMVKVI